MLAAMGTFPDFPASMPQERESFVVPIEFSLRASGQPSVGSR